MWIADQFRGRHHAHDFGDQRAPVAALRQEARVAEPLHQRHPGLGDARRVPAGGGRPGRRNRSPASTGSRRGRRPPRVPPKAVGSVSGSMILSCSMIEPGQPWVMMIGSAFSCFERTWMKWMSSPSISVRKFGKEFSRASTLRQSYSVRPIVRELLHGRELHALRIVVDRFAIGPSGRYDPPLEVGQILVGRTELERPDRCVAGRPRQQPLQLWACRQQWRRGWAR